MLNEFLCSGLTRDSLTILAMKMRTFAIALQAVTCWSLLATGLNAQELATEGSKTDTVPQALEKLQSDVTVMSRFKVSGYLQAQFQIADTAGIESVAGGNFPSGIDNRFSVRRGRFKLAYTHELSQYVIQVDATEKGVAIKDAYVSFTEPWLESFSVTAGVFDRPFGYEITYSSGSRESPERSRVVQTLFPGERDLGAKLTFQPPKTSRFNFLKIDAGLISGTGPNAIDFDRYKDFIGHVMINKTNADENIKLGLGLSYYNGGWRQGTKYVYSMSDLAHSGGNVMAFAVDSTGSAPGNQLRREYFGADAQLSLDLPFGLTVLRGEFIAGTQPGVATASGSPSVQPGDAYIRNFSGAYFYFLQDIFRTKNQLIVKYDWYDPNTAVSGNEIGVKISGRDKPTGAADIRYSTLGIGWTYKWNSHVRIIAYYDYVMNETTTALSNPSTAKDLSTNRHDNVFTLRVHYKF
jgi:hypothetical protein